jgi:putative membrane protein
MLPEAHRPFAIRARLWLQSVMLWLKACHVIFVVTWFAGLFYLPRLFVYHVATADADGWARFEVMERRLFAIMTIGAAGTLLFGIAMIVAAPIYLAFWWLRVKLLLVAALIGYHHWCRRLMRQLASGSARSQRWYRLFNEVPGLLLVAIVILAVVKP